MINNNTNSVSMQTGHSRFSYFMRGTFQFYDLICFSFDFSFSSYFWPSMPITQLLTCCVYSDFFSCSEKKLFAHLECFVATSVNANREAFQLTLMNN